MSNLIENIFNIKRSEPYIKYNKYHQGNIFGLTKTSRWELMHSNFIAWVLNPNSSHSLYNYPLYQFIMSLFLIKKKSENEKARLDDSLIAKFFYDNFILSATVEREIQHIDILVKVKTKEKILPIIIENKVDSAENGNNKDQTNQYFNWAEQEFQDSSLYFQPIYVFLFPEYNSKVQQKNENYLRMTYQELVDYVLEPSMLKCGDNNSINNFTVYLQCLSFQLDNIKGEYSMAISREERKILDEFIKENKNLLLAVLNNILDEDVDPKIKSTIANTVRDYSKYEFNGNEYKKSRLVLAVVTKYVNDKNPKDFNELLNAFPKNLQGSKGVVQLLNAISSNDKGLNGKQKRYFIDNSEILHLANGQDVAVCTEWGISNIDCFIKHATNKLGYVINQL